jgi:hypothetical protein
MKQCIACKELKALTYFHKHSRMKDGHLNKCKTCVVAYISSWRIKNPSYRKEEYIKRKPKLGITRTRQEYIADKKSKAKGRRAVVSEYTAKRRMQKNRFEMTEFDLLVQTEASDLCKLREKVTGFQWQIDHIVPLNHKSVCGLHNGYNLQVVPAKWNLSKGNRHCESYFPTC